MRGSDLEVPPGDAHYRPIPEAKAVKWGELYPSTQKALGQLLRHLEAAVPTGAPTQERELLSTSFLVNGDRGVGKTTVLLTAADAIERGPSYFPSNDADSRELGGLVDTRLRPRAFWLGTLDLEPIPRGSNLLAAVLARIRDALDKASDGRGASGFRPPASMLGGGIEKTWDELDRLVSDATFMWEEVTGPTDPRRERAQQQIKAAELFATFQQRFQRAMKSVAATLARYRGGAENPVLVLPVDNVDRSIEHIYSFVNLSRLASSPQLWFVLAAGRAEFQLFLERSFLKELATGSGRLDLTIRGQDHTPSIARRQAATTMRRSLPRGHQIQVDPLDPVTAWSSNIDGPPLCTLLGEVRLPQLTLAPGLAATMVDFFDVRERLGAEVMREYSKISGEEGWTHAARMALQRLSPRTLRDLKRSIDWELTGSRRTRAPASEESGKEDHAEHAVQIIVDMLESAIDESNLPFWASEQLHNRIIRQDMHGKWVLDLRAKPVRHLKKTHLSHTMAFGNRRNGHTDGVTRPLNVGFSDVHLRRFDDIVLELHDLDTRGNRVPLPADVAGWLMLLHDLLASFPNPRVMSRGPQDLILSPDLMVTRHELDLPPDREQVWLEFWWKLPEWDTFLDLSIFTIQWRAFLQRAQNIFQQERLKSGLDSALRFRLARAAWIDDVCSVARRKRGQWSWKEGLCDLLDGKIPSPDFEAKLAAYEKHVATQVDDLHRQCEEDALAIKGEEHRRYLKARAWLEQVLPLLLLPEFGPVKSQEVFKVVQEAWQTRDGHDVRLHQRQLVRDAAKRSDTYRALRKLCGRNCHECREWIRSVTEAWFRGADRRRGGRLVVPHPFQKIWPVQMGSSKKVRPRA